MHLRIKLLLLLLKFSFSVPSTKELNEAKIFRTILCDTPKRSRGKNLIVVAL